MVVCGPALFWWLFGQLFGLHRVPPTARASLAGRSLIFPLRSRSASSTPSDSNAAQRRHRPARRRRRRRRHAAFGQSKPCEPVSSGASRCIGPSHPKLVTKSQAPAQRCSASSLPPRVGTNQPAAVRRRALFAWPCFPSHTPKPP